MVKLDEKTWMDVLRDKKPVKCEVDCDTGFEDYGSRFSELEEKCKKGEERCTVLELEIEKKKSGYALLEARVKDLEAEKLAMEEEVKVLKRRNDELEGRVARIEDESKVGCRREREVESVVDLTEDNEEIDNVFQLMMENQALECEKKEAEDYAKKWIEKFNLLESRVLYLDKYSLLDMGSHKGLEMKETSDVSRPKGGLYIGASLDNVQTKAKTMDLDETIPASSGKGIGHLQAAGTPSIDTPYRHSVHVKGEKRSTHLQTEVVFCSRVRKQLAYGDDESPNKKMAPSTPGGARPASVGIIDIGDSDDEPDITHINLPTPEIHGNKMGRVSMNGALRGAVGDEKGMTFGNSLKRTLSDQSDEEDMSSCKGNLPFSTTPKRKRASNIVTSDSESDDADNVPISKLMKKHLQESIHDPTDSHVNSYSTSTVSGGNVVPESLTPRRRRLVTLRQCEETDGTERDSPSNLMTSKTKYHPGIPTTEDVGDDEMGEVESDTEGESLGGFIVDSSGMSDSSGASSESEDVSDGDVDFNEILSRIRRNRDQNSKWEFEADMLAAFGKDLELCMKAVCVLYRKQTTDEKSVKLTIHSNQRGFSQCDALRGTNLGEFLTDGDPQGDLKKSVKELQEHDHEGLELCRTLATHYSKQLFAIYSNKEDPYFLPS